MQTTDLNVFGQSWFDESDPDTDPICRTGCYEVPGKCSSLDNTDAEAKCEHAISLISPTGLFMVSVYIFNSLLDVDPNQ